MRDYTFTRGDSDWKKSSFPMSVFGTASVTHTCPSVWRVPLQLQFRIVRPRSSLEKII